MSILIKILDDDNRPVDTVQFRNNLTLPDAPAYRNFNGLVGLNRCTSDKYKGKLVIMYFYPRHQELSYGEFISELDAYNLCAKRNRLNVASDLHIKLTKEVEII